MRGRECGSGLDVGDANVVRVDYEEAVLVGIDELGPVMGGLACSSLMLAFRGGH